MLSDVGRTAVVEARGRTWAGEGGARGASHQTVHRGGGDGVFLFPLLQRMKAAWERQPGPLLAPLDYCVLKECTNTSSDKKNFLLFKWITPIHYKLITSKEYPASGPFFKYSAQSLLWNPVLTSFILPVKRVEDLGVRKEVGGKSMGPSPSRGSHPLAGTPRAPTNHSGEGRRAVLCLSNQLPSHSSTVATSRLLYSPRTNLRCTHPPPYTGTLMASITEIMASKGATWNFVQLHPPTYLQ